MTAVLVMIVALFAAPLIAPPAQEGLMDQEQALAMGREVEEVKALYDVDGGRWASCIEEKIERSCDSEWVTCVEDGWVVSYVFGKTCEVTHDGRLSVTLLIDAKNRKVISRFPEKEYFGTPAFCRDDHDCLAVKAGQEPSPICQNFIFAQIAGASPEGACQCAENACVTRP